MIDVSILGNGPAVAEPYQSQPTRAGDLPCGCASTVLQSAKSKAPTRIANLRLITDFRTFRERDSIQLRLLMRSLLSPVCPYRNRQSQIIDHLIRSRQHVWRNRETDLLGRFEIDYKFKLCRLLDG